MFCRILSNKNNTFDMQLPDNQSVNNELITASHIQPQVICQPSNFDLSDYSVFWWPPVITFFHQKFLFGSLNRIQWKVRKCFMHSEKYNNIRQTANIRNGNVSLLFVLAATVFLQPVVNRFKVYWQLCATSAVTYVYWTVHHCDSWRIKEQLDVTCYFISRLMCSICFGH